MGLTGGRLGAADGLGVGERVVGRKVGRRVGVLVGETLGFAVVRAAVGVGAADGVAVIAAMPLGPKISMNAEKFTLPKPVTGSHPVTALNPWVQQ
jgi:hypothetical protein